LREDKAKKTPDPFCLPHFGQATHGRRGVCVDCLPEQRFAPEEATEMTRNAWISLAAVMAAYFLSILLLAVTVVYFGYWQDLLR
jgi:hypothetical protein